MEPPPPPPPCYNEIKSPVLIGLNYRVGHFCKVSTATPQGDVTVEDRGPNGLENIDDLALKQNILRINLGVLWCLMFKTLNVQFHPN